MKAFGRVGVLMGGDSTEREISLLSGKAISSALRSSGVDVVEIGENEPLVEGVCENQIDIAFIALHGRVGEDGSIQQFLQEEGISYTGSGVAASKLAFDKIKTKKFLQENHFLTPPFEVICATIDKEIQPEQFPVVVKPAKEGSSFGVSVVHSQADLPIAIEEAFKFDQEILVESFIAGQECTVGILGECALPVVQIKPKSGVYDFQSKYTVGATEYQVLTPIGNSLSKKLQDVALKVHFGLGCRDLSRVDFIIDKNGNPTVLEVNTIPGFTQTSLLPKAAKAAGIEFEELCLRILELAQCRKNKEEKKNAVSRNQK